MITYTIYISKDKPLSVLRVDLHRYHFHSVAGPLDIVPFHPLLQLLSEFEPILYREYYRVTRLAQEIYSVGIVLKCHSRFTERMPGVR